MYLKKLKLDHTVTKTPQCFGLDENLVTRCNERITYCVFKTKNFVLENFDRPESAPANLTTRSGYLEKIFELIDDQIEYEYTLFVYEHKVSQAANAFDKYAALVTGNTEGTEIEAIDRLSEMAGERAIKANEAAKANFLKISRDLLACETFDEYMQKVIQRTIAEKLINHVFSTEKD